MPFSFDKRDTATRESTITCKYMWKRDTWSQREDQSFREKIRKRNGLIKPAGQGYSRSGDLRRGVQYKSIEINICDGVQQRVTRVRKLFLRKRVLGLSYMGK